MILTPDQIKHRLKQLGVGADKYLGQHFLIDQNILDLISSTTKDLMDSDDILVEVGPGLGVLTEGLVTLNTQVVTIEKDPVFAQALPAYVAKDNLTVIQGDALSLLETNPGFPKRFNYGYNGKALRVGSGLKEVDDSVCFDNPGSDMDWLFVANIPYAITSPLLRMLMDLEVPPRHILVLMQKEVAERLVAKPGSSERGLLTVKVELAGVTKIIEYVPPRSFWPAPKVDSALVHIDLTQPAFGMTDEEHKQFFKVVAAGFSQKRKQLANSLAGGLGMEASEARVLLEMAKIDPQRRAESLTIEEWKTLSESCTFLSS